MSFADAGGVSKWSQIVIDIEKDMQGFGITNLKELEAAMPVGAIIAYSAEMGRLAAVAPGKRTTELLTKGTRWPPVWGFPDSGEA